MPADYTTDATAYGLVGQIQTKISAPDVQALFENNDYIFFLNQELNNNLIPEIKQVNNELFVVPVDITLVPGQAAYTLPTQCIGESVRSIHQVFPGDPTGQTEFQIRRLTTEQISAYWNGLTLLPVLNNQVYGFYIQGNQVIFYPAPTQQSTVQKIRIRYFRQPNNLVSTTLCGQITAINTNTNTLTLSFIPSSWSPTTTNVCVISGIPPFSTEVESTPIVSISTPDIVLGSVAGFNVGDWVTTAGDSPIPQIPYSAFGTLVQAATVAVLQSAKDQVGMELAQQTLTALYAQMLKSLQPRDAGDPVKRSGNGNSLFDCNRRASWRTWW